MLNHIFAIGLLAGSVFALPLPQSALPPPVNVIAPQGALPPPVNVLAPQGAVPPPVEVLAGDGKAEIEFGYQGNEGPKLWPDFCQDTAPGQSPVDIRAGSADLNPGQLPVSLQALTSVTMENKGGDGIKFTPAADAAAITLLPPAQLGGAQEIFTMKDFHLHTPSEHTINGLFFDAEMHMVFESPTAQIAVVSVLMQISATAQAEPMLALVNQALPLNGVAVEIRNFDFSGIATLAGQFTNFFTYTGSLTTPPCSPNVLWHVMGTPVGIPIELALALRNEQGMNARFSQVARDEVPAFNGGLNAAGTPPAGVVPPPVVAPAPSVVPPPVVAPAPSVVPPPVVAPPPSVVPPPVVATAPGVVPPPVLAPAPGVAPTTVTPGL